MTKPKGEPITFVLRAMQVASAAHAGHTRLNGEPYINHCLRTAELVHLYAVDKSSTAICTALLHDVLEDTDVTVDDLSDLFGNIVAANVLTLTNVYTHENWPTFSREWRKDNEFARLGQCSYSIRQIKMADRISNLEDLAAYPSAWTDQRYWAEMYLGESNELLNHLVHRDDGTNRLYDMYENRIHECWGEYHAP